MKKILHALKKTNTNGLPLFAKMHREVLKIECVFSHMRVCTNTIYVLEDFCKICYSLTSLCMHKQTVYWNICICELK